MATVALTPAKDYDVDALQRIIEQSIQDIGGIEALKPGAKVLVKPNLLMKRDPDRHTTTHPAVVEAVVRAVINRGCSVTLADSPGGLFTPGILRSLYDATGMTGVAQRTGAALNFCCDGVNVEVPGAYKSHMLTVMRCAQEADCIVSVGKIKTHGLTTYTGAVKNLFGLVPGTLKVDYHARYPAIDDFCEGILDIERWARPCLSVLDGIVGMEGKGPSGGSPRRIGAMVVSDDAHAADVVGAALIGLEMQQVPTLRIAHEKAILPVPLVVGSSVDEMAVVDFRHAPSEASAQLLTNPILGRFIRSKPYVHKKMCVGCGICRKSCPAKAIEIKGGIPRFDYKACIRCYCCQELCPQTAVDVWQPFFMKWLR